VSGGLLRRPGETPRVAGLGELFVRHVRKEGRSVVVLRAVDNGDSCSIEIEVFPRGAGQPVHPGPYTFPDARAATAFATEAIEALMYLGCDVQAQ
jgi:hypothetical protein